MSSHERMVRAGQEQAGGPAGQGQASIPPVDGGGAAEGHLPHGA